MNSIMDLRMIVLIGLLIFCVCRTEGFIYQQNLSEDNEYPDKTQFYVVANHNTIQLKNDIEREILGNNNYKLVNNTIKEPQHGAYSAFLDVNELRSFDQFYHSPITDETYGFDVSYDKQLNYEIIQAEDINKKELLNKEKDNDKLIHNPFYLYGHPKNNSKILYSDEIQDMFLKVKGIYNRHTDIGIRGGGHHDHEF